VAVNCLYAFFPAEIRDSLSLLDGSQSSFHLEFDLGDFIPHDDLSLWCDRPFRDDLFG
jgi:hypothetical protein